MHDHVHVCLGCAVLLCLVCLFDLACLLLSFISHLKTCIYMCTGDGGVASLQTTNSQFSK